MPARFHMSYALLALFALQVAGCIISIEPMFTATDAVIEPTLKGTYRVSYRGSELMPSEEAKNAIPDEFEIFLKDRQYLIVEKDTIVILATLQSLSPKFYVAQIRWTTKPLRGGYIYAVFRPTQSGFEMSRIRCDPKSGTAFQNHCDAEGKEMLMRVAKKTMTKFGSERKDMLIADRR
jgi:hypothetical protein